MTDTPVTSAESLATTWAARRTTFLQASAIALAALWAFWPALHGGWLWDDMTDVTDNKLLRSAGGLWKIWLDPQGLFDYYPIKYTVQWIQWHLWGNATFGYHLTNLGLHLIGALLFWRLLGRLGVRHGWLGGLLFAVHPLTVESVAWITELKNALSLPPLLLACIAFLDYAERGRRIDLSRSLLWFLLSMLCKTSGVMLPVVLLLLAWWRRRRIARSDLAAAAPFFALSLAFGLLTIWFQYHRAQGGDASFNPIGGMGSHLACAGSSLAFYLWKSVLPFGLQPIYPRWSVDPLALWHLLPWLGFALLLCGCWRWRATWGRHVLLGFGWFALFLAPFLGFVPISYMRFAWVMDHIAYLPLLGPVGLAAAAASAALGRYGSRARACTLAASLAVCALLAWTARVHAAIFRDARSLWTFVLEHNPQDETAHHTLGQTLIAEGKVAEGLGHLEQAVHLKPDSCDLHVALASALHKAGRDDEARRHLEEATRLRPAKSSACYNLGLALIETGQADRALVQFEEAVRLRPDWADALESRGELLRLANRVDEAVRDFRRALQADPDCAEASNHLGMALIGKRNFEEAIGCFRAALRSRPDYAEAHNNLGSLLASLGRLPESIEHFERAVALRPDFDEARLNLGLVLIGSGHPQEAADCFEKVLDRQPESLKARFNLANVLVQLGRGSDAVAHYERALLAQPNHPAIHTKLAAALGSLGRLPAAVEHCETALRADPDNVEARALLARILAMQGRTQEARTHYQRARELDPSLPPADF